MILKIYQLLTLIFSPLIELYLVKRRKIGKEDAQRFDERFGKSSIARPEGGLIWVHAASVGEALSVIPMIKKIGDKYPDANFLVTTGTTTSANIIESRLPDRAFHQYIPVDSILSVRRFLNHWKPNLAIWVESEFWPNLVTQTGKYCPIILVNGRISDNSYKQWQKYPSFSRQVISRFSLALPQSKHDAERLERLGARNVKYIGNIKFDAPSLPSDPKKMGELVSMIGQRQVWLASSTHKGEEQIIANIHKSLKEDHPELLTIIAPRHPKRAEEIKSELGKLGLNIAVRSKDEPITDETDIYLADTLGELGVFYRLVPIVFIGGSLVDKGGQNPLEAARLDSTIIYGPYMDNFMEIKHEMEENKASILVKDAKDLQSVVEELINDHEKQEKIAKAALKMVEDKAGIIDSYVTELSPYIEQFIVKKDEAA